MTQLFFRYGTMNSGKTLDLLKVVHNYEEQNKSVVILTPSIDTRSDVNSVKSRIGISHQALVLEHDFCVKDILPDGHLDCILVDESQFLTSRQIDELLEISCKVPVICYGLRTDFTSHLFEGSKRLCEVADKIEEIKTTCYFCNHKATFNMLMENGKPVKSGKQIHIGDKEYISVCKEHYLK